MKRNLKVEAEKTSGSPGNRFLLWIHNLKCPQVLADTQEAMQEACMCKHCIQLIEKQTQNSLTLEVCGKLRSSRTIISPGLEIRSKLLIPSGLKYLFYCCLTYFKECRRLSSPWQKCRKSVPVTKSTKEVSLFIISKRLILKTVIVLRCTLKPQWSFIASNTNQGRSAAFLNQLKSNLFSVEKCSQD